jgi:transcriptional regulator with XRE-family HTH domain
MHGSRPQVSGLFPPPNRETSLHAISRALLRLRANGWSMAELAKLLDCSADTIENASNERTLLNFESVARLGYHFPDEFNLIETLWTCRAVSPPTQSERLATIRKHLDALEREVVA